MLYLPFLGQKSIKFFELTEVLVQFYGTSVETFCFYIKTGDILKEEISQIMFFTLRTDFQRKDN